MNKRIGRLMVDVAYPACGPALACYALGFDKGTFVQGRGYTSYREKPLAVCWTRHLHGCPTAWVCPAPCSTVHGAGRADYVRALPGDQGAALMRPGVRAEDMPLCRYRDALLLKTKLRKAGKCTLCWEPMKVGDPAWRVIQDNMKRGVVRSQRFHRDHFSGGGHYDD